MSGSNAGIVTIEDKYRHGVRTLSLQIFLWACTVVILYILIMLISHEKAIWIRRQSAGLLAHERSPAKRYGSHLRAGNLIATSALLARNIIEHLEILLEVHADVAHCNVIVMLKFFSTAVFVTAIYMFLWIRQRMCYSNPLMSHLTSTLTHGLSWASLGALLIAEVAATSLFMWTRTYEWTKLGCDIAVSYVPQYLPWVFYGISTAVFQVILLGLFIYPLSKQQTIITRKLTRERTHKLVPLIKRSLAACLVCVITNLVMSLIVIVVEEPFNVVPIVLYNVNLIINLAAVIASFSKWRVILFPFCYKARVRSIDTTHSIDQELSSSTRRDPTSRRLLSRAQPEKSSSVFSITSPSSAAVESDVTEHA